MPSPWTFTIKPIAELLSRYVGDGKGWIDPFAGETSPAEFTNDLNTERPTTSHLDALEWLKSLLGSYQGVLFDPPYSITQAKECYNGIGMAQLSVKPTSMQYWGDAKNEVARIIKPDGIAICCGWTSQGIGKNRGFEMLEILLVPHGGSKNDTIVTVERKIQTNLL
jgi:hypothetical protein